MTMKKILLFTALFVCFGLSSCQCSDKPEIGPVEQARVPGRAADQA